MDRPLARFLRAVGVACVQLAEEFDREPPGGGSWSAESATDLLAADGLLNGPVERAIWALERLDNGIRAADVNAALHKERGARRTLLAMQAKGLVEQVSRGGPWRRAARWRQQGRLSEPLTAAP